MNYESFHSGIIALIRSAITKEKSVMPMNFNYDEAYRIGMKHQIANMLYYGAVNSEILLPDGIREKMFHITALSMIRSENQLLEAEKVFEAFEHEGIDYLPLKGVLLKKLYPSTDMRIMGDADILVRVEQYSLIRPLMIRLGYTEVTESTYEWVWDKPQLLHVELHTHLVSPYNKDYYEYYDDAWRLAKRSGAGICRYRLSEEDQFVYLFTHFSKHFRNAGIGIRFVVDLWVYLRHNQNMDFEYLESELSKLGLLQFYENIRRLISVWFEGAENDKISELLTFVIFNSNTYGTHESQVASEMVKALKSTRSLKAAKLHKLWSLIFLSYPNMCKKYSFIQRAPMLLPLMWIVRLVDIVLFKRSNIKKQKTDLQIASQQLVADYQSLLNAVGLDFNFKE